VISGASRWPADQLPLLRRKAAGGGEQ